MKRIFNFGIVGCGAAATTHARLLSELKGARLVGVSDKNAEAAKSFAKEYGAKAYESYESMLSDPNTHVSSIFFIDKVVNLLYNYLDLVSVLLFLI